MGVGCSRRWDVQVDPPPPTVRVKDQSSQCDEPVLILVQPPRTPRRIARYTLSPTISISPTSKRLTPPYALSPSPTSKRLTPPSM